MSNTRQKSATHNNSSLPTFLFVRPLSVAIGSFFLLAVPRPAAAEPPIRVAIVGLVHGHVKGFLAALPGNQAATLVAIVEPQEALAKEYAAKYRLDAKLFYTDLEKMLAEQHPGVLLVYTPPADHRKVVEVAARER